MKNLFLTLVLLLSVSVSLFSQVHIEGTTNCGYGVTVYIKPIDLITTPINANSFKYRIKFHYDIITYIKPGENGCGNIGNSDFFKSFNVSFTCSGNKISTGELPKSFPSSSGDRETDELTYTGPIPIGNATLDNICNSQIEVEIKGPGGLNIKVPVPPGALPIELLYFDAIANNNQVELSWATASEKNNDYFTIERTVGGITFEEIARVAGQGNSSIKFKYSFTDTRPKNGTSYYRLKQTDYNGESEYFEVRSVNIQRSDLVYSIYPNPNRGSFTIEISSDAVYADAQLVLTDMTGKVIAFQQVNIAVGTTQMMLEDLELEMGTYLVTLRGADQKIKPVKVMVTK